MLVSRLVGSFWWRDTLKGLSCGIQSEADRFERRQAKARLNILRTKYHAPFFHLAHKLDPRDAKRVFRHRASWQRVSRLAHRNDANLFELTGRSDRIRGATIDTKELLVDPISGGTLCRPQVSMHMKFSSLLADRDSFE